MKLFQIYYDDASKRLLDPAFIPLSNVGSERPDWFEYWPIRQALLNNTFEEDEYLGFFSPRFREKTGLSGSEVVGRMGEAKGDVVSFSPLLYEGILFLNSFHQADSVHPGCMRLSQEFLDATGVGINLRLLVQDQTRTIFSNYFVAKYRFWKKWYQLTTQFFELCERQEGVLVDRLTENTRHRGREGIYQMKIFIMERLVSIVLEMEKINAEKGVSYAAASHYGTGPIFNNLMILEALKGQYIKTGDRIFMGLYTNFRQEFMGAVGQRR